MQMVVPRKVRFGGTRVVTLMTNIEQVWDNGTRRVWEPYRPGAVERTLRFVELTGATCVVKLQWTYQGVTVTCPYPATVLPDLTGVVLCDEWHFQGQPREGTPPYPKHLRVLNPDGSLRLRIYPPRLDEHSRPEDSWIEEPRNFSERGIPFGAPASDGHYDMVVEYDWQTGEMLRWINAAPWFRY